jgi:cardiolipin synthase
MSPRRMSRRILAGVLTVAAVLALALLFAQDQETIRLRSELGASDPAFPQYASVLTGEHVTHGDRYEVLTNGVQIFPAMLQAIRHARSRISLETYIYDKGTVADTFTAALIDAARRGVAVRVTVDAVGASSMRPRTKTDLKAAGAELAEFNALHWYSIEEVNYRTHRKIMVVDGEVGFTGGAGFADHWQGNAASPDEWRDTHFRVTGPAVTRLEGAFYENWSETGATGAPHLDLAEAGPSSGGARSLVSRSSPTGGSNSVKLLYLLSIAAARRTLEIQTPYFVLDESTEWALREARSRGVRVRLLLEGDRTDAKSVKDASRNDYQRLLDAGVQIHEFQPTMMHVKAMVVDGVWSLVGSANFDNRSFELNDELIVAVADASLAERLLVDFEADLARSRRIEPELWRHRSWTQRARERFWGMFSELF